MQNTPNVATVNWENHYRIIPSVYPPINFFEDLVDPAQMEIALHLEGLTNDRLREEAGISGNGSSIVMAAFTHIGKPSRFTDGTYGVYYAGNTLETAVRETVFHREIFLSSTKEEPGNIDMRVYVGTILKPMHDLRGSKYKDLHDPLNYQPSQLAGAFIRTLGSWGVVYNSVRNKGGECIGIFRPSAISVPKQSKHLVYVWDGEQISFVYQKSLLSFS